MANPVLHIKDSYYFEVPKVLCPSDFKSLNEFPAVWVSLDPEFQDWEFERIYDRLAAPMAPDPEHSVDEVAESLTLPPREAAHKAWREWQHHDHANFGKPFHMFLEEVRDEQRAEFDKYKAGLIAEAEKSGDKARLETANLQDFSGYLNQHVVAHHGFRHFSQWLEDVQNRSLSSSLVANDWTRLYREAGDVGQYKKEFQEKKVKEWSPEKIKAYNYHLSGKILIPQPFGTLQNLYEKEPGLDNVCISKFMVIEMAVCLALVVTFGWLGRKIAAGGPPKGKLWNLLETFCVFIRDEIAEPSIGHHDAKRFLPYLWTIFFFILGCNLSGMLPWVGAPTGTFAVTLALALMTLAVVVSGGMKQFGFFGFFKNLVPHMGLPWYMAILIVPVLWAIELIGLLVKHGVLAVRLLANMVAGHLVLLGLMGVAFSVEAVTQFQGSNVGWSVAAVISVLACTAFSCMELFVAFLQAYIFTFLSALFIGSVMHEH